MAKKAIQKSKVQRNGSLIDQWSFVHMLTCIALTLFLGPLATAIIVTLWEPIEIFLISPLVAKAGFLFGHESLQNSISDIAFNFFGIGIGVYLSNIG